MLSYMIKILVGIAYEQNQPTGVASALRAQFGFWAKSALKLHCTKKKNFRQKLLQITMRNFWYKNIFDRRTGVASALLAQFVFFLVKSALKMSCTKFSYQIKVVTNQYPQLLCYVTFFDILHNYGVIAASQICSVLRKYCAVLRNRFFTFSAIQSRESIAFAQKINIQILINLHVLRATESKKVIFGMSSVGLSVCLWPP